MTRKWTVLTTLLTVACLAACAGSPTSALAGPKWRLDSQSNSSLAPGSVYRITANAFNAGDAALNPAVPVVFKATLPEGMRVADPSNFIWLLDGKMKSISSEAIHTCTGPGGAPLAGGESVVECEFSDGAPPRPREDTIQAFASAIVNLVVSIAPDASGIRTIRFDISGGGAPSATLVDPTLITTDTPAFGIDAFDASPRSTTGALYTRAGGHPYDYATYIDFNTLTHPAEVIGDRYPVEPTKNIDVDLPPGMVGNVTAIGKCTLGELASEPTICPARSQVGTIEVRINTNPPEYSRVGIYQLPLFNMEPPVGVPARFGFKIQGETIILDAKLRYDGDYGLTVGPKSSPQGLAFNGTTPIFWGTPADSSHDAERACPVLKNGSFTVERGCSVGELPRAFLRMPTRCTGPERISVHMDSWYDAGARDRSGLPDLSDPAWETASITSHEGPGFPANPADPSTPWGPEKGLDSCSTVPVKGTLEAKPTSIDTETSSGLKVHVEVPNQGLQNPSGISSSDIKTVRVALPEGMTINPSQAEGLGVCSPDRYASTELSFFPTPGKGCPDEAKIGSVEVKTPLLEETIPGDVYVAKPFDNPFGSLLALYVVLHEPERGIMIKLAGKVDTDERTGQITTTFDDLPQQPFDTFDFKFREGARAPLVTPQACGTYETSAQFTGWSDPANPITSTSSFDIVHGIGGGPCPSGGLPPFKPGLVAGSINNAAGHYSPFNLRLFRTDAEQEITHFSIKLPPGISGKLAGVPFCSDAAIEASKAKSGEQELASPSCPKASEVGHTLAGAGVGPVLTYAPGKIYLAGPYNGSALSIAAITAAKVGPFDLGTVVVRQALKVDPETAEVFIDATGSDPIPHIIDGVTTHIRDIRAYVDRPDFTLNPTSCDRTSTASTLLGSGLDFASAIDDRPVTVSTPYQAADCAALGFKPDLKIALKGATKRGGFPKLRAVLKMRKGEANIGRAQVTLPRSEFLANAHIGTVCTRVQYVKDQCPAKSVYGYARAFTPLLDEPLEGPVYLRSSEHKLPDLVAALHSGRIEIDLAGKIDSPDGRIRNTFEAVPDAPVSKFVLTMQGGKKGLLENSTNLCRATNRAVVQFDGQNGKVRDFNPAVKPECSKAKRKAAKRRSAR
jgi:hypothetical protein